MIKEKNIYWVYSGLTLVGSLWAAIGTMVRTRGCSPLIGTLIRCRIGTTMSGFAGICIRFILRFLKTSNLLLGKYNATKRYLSFCGTISLHIKYIIANSYLFKMQMRNISMHNIMQNRISFIDIVM